MASEAKPRTARRDVSVKTLPTAAYSSVGTTCATSPEQSEVMELQGYSRPTYNKLVHSATMRSADICVIHKPTADELVNNTCRSTVHRLVAVGWRNFLSPQCRNYSRDPDLAHLGDSQSTSKQSLKSITSAVPDILHVV